MNFPIWEIPGGGLLIAAVAILHVFVSHFAVGGGLFLVLTERKARRDGDEALLAFVRRHTRFFVLLTLVLGAVTGVGIWFTIGLVHPSATSSLIQVFVWFWAIEWTFFFTEIAAALVYYYGWDRLTPAAHLRVGWVYFWSAWLSLVAINGILTFMLTPGAWPATRDVWSAFFNPTYWPALVARSCAAIGLAGLYALLTASWMADQRLKRTLASYAGAGWVLPMAIALPLSLGWYLWAAASAGIPVGGIFGAPDAALGDVLRAVLQGRDSGYPTARLAALVTAAGGLALVLLVIGGVLRRSSQFGLATTLPLLLVGLVTFGGAEFVREDLRKPFIIGEYMFVHAVRLPGFGQPARVASSVGTATEPADAFAIDALTRNGLLATARYVRSAADHLPADDVVGRQEADGRVVYRLLCASCHTLDGYLAIRPLVAGRPVAALDGVIANLAVPVDATGQPVSWEAPRAGIATWRGRHMPPFAGTEDERRALAVYLALLGGADRDRLAAEAAVGDAGQQYFEGHCAMCHADDGQWSLRTRRARSAAEFYDLLGRLPEVNDLMPPFAGDEAERRAVAAYLETLTTSSQTGESLR